MQNTSNLYKELIKQSGRTFKARILVNFPDGSSTELTDDNIMQNSLVITTGTSDEGSFSIGNAVIGQLEFEIDNSSGEYDNMSFEDAELTVRIGLVTNQVYDGMMITEWLKKGKFTVEEVTVDENYIKITAYDNMAKFDVPFSSTGISFPRSIGTLYQNICTYCGVPYGSVDFDNADVVIRSSKEIDENASCRDILSYIAQLCCRYVHADVNGTVLLDWYNDTDYEITEQQKLNGTVMISGVQLTDTQDQTWVIGNKNYCIMIEDNPLALNQAAMTSGVWEDVLIGMELTPFSADILSDPSVEAGDIVTVSDLHGNAYRTPITNMIYRLDSKMTVSCDAETLREKQRTSCSSGARIAAQTNRKINKKISEYDIRAKQFSELTANAMGFYQTEKVQDDGSTIVYQHDKPLLSESTVIWKKSADSFAVSTDGGTTWKGMDSSGNSVLNILAAVGIVADWIKVGNLNADLITTGSLAGWKINGRTLVSPDGTIKLDAQNNRISLSDLVILNQLGMQILNQNGDRIGSVSRTSINGEDHVGINLTEYCGGFSLGVWNGSAFASKFYYDADYDRFIFDTNTEVRLSNLMGKSISFRTGTDGNGNTIQYVAWE